MTSDIAAPRGGSVLPRLPWILLALSLALNVFFVGGVFWARGAAPPPPNPAERIEAVSKELALNSDQRTAFNRFITTMRMRSRHLHESNQPLMEDAWEELGKAQPNEDVINRTIEETGRNRHAFQVEASRAFRTFLATLNDEQRAKFIELVRDRQNRDVPPLLRQLVQ